MSETRTGKRFDLSLPVKIKQTNSSRTHQATTHNLSAAGVYITANLPFKSGTKVEFEITLPAPVIGAKNNVDVKCEGRVIRVDPEQRGKRRGVACIIDKYQFVPEGKPAAKPKAKGKTQGAR
ncbi:MAG: PilZ domain-containing protein [Terriglobales bacterium]